MSYETAFKPYATNGEKPTAIEMRCTRCKHLIGIDYGRRMDIVHDTLVVHIIVSEYAGRCVACYNRFEWYPSRRKFA